MQDELLGCLARVWPYVGEVLTSDVSVTLTDREKFIFAKPGKKLDLRIKASDHLKPGSAVVRAMAEKRRVVVRADKSLFGVPYIAVAIPLFDARNEVVGAASVQKISAQAEEIAATSRALSQATKESYACICETDQVLNLIKAISSQTNLLGLNAAIESARVGEHGRGFGVVAEEIRKLAASSAESIKKIEAVIKDIQADSGGTSKQVEQIGGIMAQIADAITHIAGTVQQTSQLARQLDTLADSLSAEDR